MTQQPLPTIVLGGSGYVAGEMLRLIAAHPQLTLSAAVSTSLAGKPVGATFQHLRRTYPEHVFADIDGALGMLSEAEHWALLSAAPHGASAQLVERFVAQAASQGSKVTAVDASADFRFSDAALFAEVYGHEHATPALLRDFTCAVPEHLDDIATPHAAHPGCFATAMLLGIVPLLASELAGPDVYVSAVTGSTGAGRTPRETTHHPVRQSNLFAYQLLQHRHSPEVTDLASAATGRTLNLHFVPHSGPFARGIHATIFAPVTTTASKADVTEALTEFYAGSDLVTVADEPPRMKDIAGSNQAVLSVDVDADTIVVCSVLDNLLKGAASGSVQWLNRLLGLPDSTGLTAPSPGWL